jgi:hypothetical protein
MCVYISLPVVIIVHVCGLAPQIVVNLCAGKESRTEDGSDTRRLTVDQLGIWWYVSFNVYDGIYLLRMLQ